MSPLALTGKIRPLLFCLSFAYLEGQALPKADPPVFVPADSVYARQLNVKIVTQVPRGRILYTHSRTPPDTAEGGGTFLFGAGIYIGGFDSTILSARTVAPGHEPSNVVTKIYYKEKTAKIVSAVYTDQDGDGRIGHVYLNFAIDLPALPQQFDFRLTDPDGRSELRQVRADRDQIRFQLPEYRGSVVIELKEPFPLGMTSLIRSDSAGRTHAQADIPLAEYYFPIQDKVCPIILDAKLLEAGDGRANGILYVTFSEDMILPEDVYQPFEYLKGGKLYAFYDVKYGKPEKIGRRTYAFPLLSNPWFQPAPGDSVAITRLGEIGDLAGNTGSTVDPFRFAPIVKTLVAPVGLRAGHPLRRRAISVGGRGLVWSGSPEPLALDCLDLEGAFLGKAQRRENRWELRPGTRVIRARMPNGSRNTLLVSPAQ
jgi:hypothetical protein